jgi:hypothetical protein
MAFKESSKLVSFFKGAVKKNVGSPENYEVKII